LEAPFLIQQRCESCAEAFGSPLSDRRDGHRVDAHHSGLFDQLHDLAAKRHIRRVFDGLKAAASVATIAQLLSHLL
jgi:hypothetical protein